jgi:hypothetical protein
MGTVMVETADGRRMRIENGVVKSWGDGGPPRSFGVGNKSAAIRHGAYSDAIVAEHATQVMEELVGLYPQVAFMPARAIERYCLAEARLDQMYEAMAMRFDQIGVLETMKETPTLMAEIAKSEQISLNYAKELGLTVAAWASIAKNMGFARHYGADKVDELTSEGRKIREAQGRPSTFQVVD